MPRSRLQHATAAQPQPNGLGVLARAPPIGSGDFCVVGLGASAGGLDACRKFVDALPADNGMAFILVQHLDPTHESVMVDLLGAHTAMVVRQAADGMPIEPDHLYVIPPGSYLAVRNRALRLSRPMPRHGARLPFDFLLHSLSEEYGERAICVILSGTGADGSLGLKAVKAKGGLVIAQDAGDAGYDGMPRSAIMTGAVDLVLPVARIPQAIVEHDRQVNLGPTRNEQHQRDARFEIPRSRPEIAGLLTDPGAGVPRIAFPAERQTVSRQSVYAELCRRLVIETYAPAAVLINGRYECLYSVGPTDRYLRVPPGHPTHDLLAMARQNMRTRLLSAIQQARDANMRVIVAGGRMSHNGYTTSFNIDVQPVQSDGEDLLLICFVDEPAQERKTREADKLPDTEIARELELTRAELRSAIRDLEIASEDQWAAEEEALSINEEYQSTNEELLTSKEEQQSLNEALTTLDAQLQESLEQQRAIANDLQNVLLSTDVATVFLDGNLNIRFFTPATRLLFSVIASDIGRPLADLTSLAADDALLADAKTVMQTLAPIEREIEGKSGTWYSRRIAPYRTQDSTEDRAVAGVVITFVDITGRRRVADELEAARRQAESANIVKSRFLAAASHDLRQPLQTLALVHGLLSRTVQGDNAQKLIARLDETLGAMSGMLNTLLDINQIETGSVQAEITSFPINELLNRLHDEFTYHAQAKRLDLRVVPCGLSIRSDPRLLEQMLRNLLSNALKYTRTGKVLLGCRRHGGTLSIEVWDTGVGIPEGELHAIFEEYHQLDNPARERSRGLGLGLAIVQRLARLLDHPVRVRSQPAKGSVFAIEVALPPIGTMQPDDHRRPLDDGIVAGVNRTGQILVIEDDPEMCRLLDMALRAEGHTTATASDGTAALKLIAGRAIQPDLILADYNLPNDMNGLQAIALLHARLHRRIPAIILTGDISSATSRDIARANCRQLNKPVKLQELTQVIQRLLPASHAAARSRAQGPGTMASRGLPVIFVVDDDENVREGMRALLEAAGMTVEDYASCEAFLAASHPRREQCLVIDGYLPGMSGLELLQRLRELGHQPPAIMITGYSDVSMAVQAMKAGVSDFIEKPVGGSDLLASIGRALERSRDQSKTAAWREDAAIHVGGLTARQRQIMHLVLAGHHSKNIALDLGISRCTVENHRAAIMKKTGTKSLPALARLALAAAGDEAVGSAEYLIPLSGTAAHEND